MYYILDENKEPKQVEMIEWARWFEGSIKKDSPNFNHPRYVRRTLIGSTYISTVFLGIDHSFSPHPNHVPILFETMIFSKSMKWVDGYQTRCATYRYALEMHKIALRFFWIEFFKFWKRFKKYE
jgi:hypothetical protein